MGVQWPLALLSLLVLPLLVAAYVWHNRRRRKQAVRHSSVALIRAAAPKRAGWKRHLPFALVLAALGLLGVAAARPEVAMDVPISDSTIILALDVSGSMCSTDVDPNRLTAATTAVREFVQNQDDETRIGLVVFSDNPYVVSPLTFDHNYLLRYVDFIDDQILQNEGQTAIGDGLALSNYMLSRQAKEGSQGHQVIVLLVAASILTPRKFTAVRTAIKMMATISPEVVKVPLVFSQPSAQE